MYFKKNNKLISVLIKILLSLCVILFLFFKIGIKKICHQIFSNSPFIIFIMLIIIFFIFLIETLNYLILLRAIGSKKNIRYF